jgi:hypothetical protein
MFHIYFFIKKERIDGTSFTWRAPWSFVLGFFYQLFWIAVHYLVTEWRILGLALSLVAKFDAITFDVFFRRKSSITGQYTFIIYCPLIGSNLVWVDNLNVRSLIRLCNGYTRISKDRGIDYNYLMGSTLNKSWPQKSKRNIVKSGILPCMVADLLSSYVFGTHHWNYFYCGWLIYHIW